MASLGLWTLPFCSLARISPTFCSVASLPIESTPVSFLGWHLNGVGPLPPPAATTTTAGWQGPPVGRRARGTWTATLDYVQNTLHLGAMLLATQDGHNEYARDKRPGLLVPHFAGCYATKLPLLRAHGLLRRLSHSLTVQYRRREPVSRARFPSARVQFRRRKYAPRAPLPSAMVRVRRKEPALTAPFPSAAP